MLAPHSRFLVNTAEVAGQVMDGEAVIMNLSTGMYYSMDRIGAVIWESIAQGRSAGEIAIDLTGRYEVSPETATADLERLIAELLEEKLVQADGVGQEARESNEATAALPPSATPRSPYAPPQLNRYSDMADLLALDPPMPVTGTPWTAPEQTR